MTIIEFATFYKIVGINEDMKSTLEIIDELSSYAHGGEKVPLGYKVDHVAKTLLIPKGYGLHKLNNKYRNFNLITEGTTMPYIHNTKEIRIKNKPFEYQETIRQHAKKVFMKETQMIVDLPAGKGKSNTGLYIMEDLNVPTLLLVKENRTKDQWLLDVFYKNSNYNSNDIFIITGTSSLPYLESISTPSPVYIATHSAMRNILNLVKFQGLNALLMRMGVGLKIIDEFDLEFRSTIDIDLFTSIRYNLYMTATVMKSSKSENAVFQRSFENVQRMGKEFFKDEKPNRDCVWVNFKSYPDPKERFLIKNYNGEFSVYLYNDYLFNKKRELLIDLIKDYINEFKNEYPEEDKCIIYCEKIESCDTMVEILTRVFGIKYNQIGLVNTSVSDDVKRLSLHKKWIVTTVKSCGRALDIKGLTYIINLETYASIPQLIQQASRVGRVGGKRGKFITFVDHSILEIIMFNKGKDKELDDLFDDIKIRNYSTKDKTYVDDKLLI